MNLLQFDPKMRPLFPEIEIKLDDILELLNSTSTPRCKINPSSENNSLYRLFSLFHSNIYINIHIILINNIYLQHSC